MVIKAETIRLLSDTLVVRVVWILEGVGVDPALLTVSIRNVKEVVSTYSSCSLLDSQAKGDNSRDRDGPHDRCSDGVGRSYTRGLNKRMKIFPKEGGSRLTKDVRVEKRMTLLLNGQHDVNE